MDQIINNLTASNCIGYFAGFLSTVRYAPQIVKTHRSKSSKDLSWGMLNIAMISQMLTLLYGYLNYLYPIIIPNIIASIFSIIMIIQKMKYDYEEKEIEKIEEYLPLRV